MPPGGKEKLVIPNCSKVNTIWAKNICPDDGVLRTVDGEILTPVLSGAAQTGVHAILASN